MKYFFQIIWFVAFLIAAPAFFMVAPAGGQTVPNGSFLKRFCAENPKDDYCVRVAAVNKQQRPARQSASPQISLRTYQMIKRGNVRRSPNTATRANIIGQLNAGQQFAPNRRFTNAGITWFEIELSDGQKAYLSTSLAKKIR